MKFRLGGPLALVLAAVATAAFAVEAEDEAPEPQLPRTTICSLIDAAALRHELPVEFFTRLLWKESRFQQDAVSPKGAQGIAQFMPGTAALRGLADPFDPVAAIAASAHYLRDLSVKFGNIGLAAAAYNAGERRLSDWLAGTGGLPYETRDFVLSITGRTAEEWNLPGATHKVATGPLPPDERPLGTCLGVVAHIGKPGVGLQVVSNYPRAGWAPWGVQVAGNFSLNRAMATYAGLQSRYAEILGGQAPMVVSERSRSRGSAAFHLLRVPADSREAAAEICNRLKAAGAACLVMKTAGAD